MAKLIDDSESLDKMADGIVSGEFPHVTAVIRAMGIPRGHPDERRLLKKWAALRDILMPAARARHEHRDREQDVADEAYARGYAAGWQRGLDAAQTIMGRRAPEPVPERRPSWLSRLFTWAA